MGILCKKEGLYTLAEPGFKNLAHLFPDLRIFRLRS